MAKKRNARDFDAPQLHGDHPRPVTRRQFVAQGFRTGAAYAVGGGILSAMATSPRLAQAALSGDLDAQLASCGIATSGAGKIPFICFDLAGGANIAGSNVLIGQEGGQQDFLNTSGYERQGLPGDMIPGLVDPVTQQDYANFDLGLGFHLDSAFRRGILASLTPGREANINGAVIPARSDNDTGNNPHNPMYGIARAGANGSILTLAGSENTDSGGNSMLPAMLYDPELRPTKVDRPSDVVNLVDTGDLAAILSPRDATAVMESIYRLTGSKMGNVSTQLAPTDDAAMKRLVECGYLKAADIADRFAGVPVDPSLDPEIVGPTGIFTDAEFNAGDRDAREDGRDHETGHERLRRCRLYRNGRLRLPRRPPCRRRGQGFPRRPLHGRLPRVRRTPRHTPDDVRLQRRLSVFERRYRQHRRGPRQGRVVKRQLLDRRCLLPCLQPGTKSDAHRWHA